jgi:hypothetical protein
MPNVELDTAALCADRIIEAISTSTLASIAPTTDNTEFQRCFDEIFCKMENLSSSLTNFDPGNIVPAPETLSIAPTIAALAPGTAALVTSHSRDGTATTICWYHSRFEANAKKCSQPCIYKSKEIVGQQTSAEALQPTADYSSQTRSLSCDS